MAVPALPPALDTGDVVSNTRVDATYDLLEFHRDNLPTFRQTIEITEGVPDATETAVDFSDGAGAFSSTPTINVGGWTAASGGNEEIVVPETGVYHVSIGGLFAADADGYRYVVMSDDGANVSAIRSQIVPGAATAVYLSASGLHFFTASDRLGVNAFQSSGASMVCTFYIHAHWINSAVS